MNKSTNKLRNYTRRVDVQASAICTCLVVCACLCLYFIHYKITYDAMIKTLTSRAEAVYHYLDEVIDERYFSEITTKEDMDTEIYASFKNMLEEIRKTSNIRYLYTAQKTSDGNYIYVVDGLDSTSADFRYPGDIIEKENIPDIEKAYSGEIVLPNTILKTSWGKIFLAYFPIHHPETKEIIGVLGIEFDAENEYDTFENLKIITPIIILIICIIALIISARMFRRISNPRHRDLYNTDELTSLKNRNAFEIDLHNINVKGPRTDLGILILDLNNLKKVNDTKGHIAGDLYIKNTAVAIRSTLNKDLWAYRTGGDEFAVIMPMATRQKMDVWIEAFQKEFQLLVSPQIPFAGAAVGKAIFSPPKDGNLFDTCNRADADMYEDKRSRKKDRYESEQNKS